MAVNVIGKSEPRGISVLISGAGVGGLMTALECWRRGCAVRIFERTGSEMTTGDSFTIGISAINSFKNWPDMQAENERIAYNPLFRYCDHTGRPLTEPTEYSHFLSDRYHEGVDETTRAYRHSRPKFHKMLHHQLSAAGIEVEYGREVVEYFEDAEAGLAGVVLRDGTRHQSDLVVAADGAKGASPLLITGHDVPARSSGDAIFRVAYPVELALADSLVRERFTLTPEGRSVMEMWLGQDMHASFWRNKDQMTWLITHPDRGTATDSWGHKATKAEVLDFTKTVPDWPEVADRVIKTTPSDQIVDWKLMWRDPQPLWTSPAGRVVQLGDAAHTFLPSSGNGGTQAIEDAVSLATCISLAGDRARLPEATRVHNLLRFERVSCLQAYGVLNAEKANSGSDVKLDSVSEHMIHIGKWITHHDPELYAAENYARAAASFHSGSAFLNTNVPYGISYEPWTIDGLREALRKKEATIFDSGDWS